MFILFGTKYVESKASPYYSKRGFCTRCNQERDLANYENRQYFTLFFLPVFPMGAGEDYVKCETCGATYHKAKEDYSVTKNSVVKEIISCAHCGDRIRVPVDRNKYKNITCPNCNRSPFHEIK